jgi:hypothetical protein
VGITQYNVALFLHITVVLVSFMIAAVLHAALHVLTRAKTVQQMRPFAHLIHRLEPLLPILAIFIFGFGMWLIGASHKMWHFGDGWILTGFITLVVIEGLAGALLAPHSKKLVAAVEAAPDGEPSAELRRQALDPFVWYIAHVATVGFLGVVFVMTNKPSGGAAVVIVIIAAIVGLGLAKLQLDAAEKQIA